MSEATIIELLNFESISEIVHDRYDLGELTSAVRIYNGYVNITNDIQLLKDGQIENYILRIYREGTREKKICFEHELINALQARGFGLSPLLIRTRDRSTYVKVDHPLTDDRQELFIAIYQYLPGEDKYSWDNPGCSISELSHAAEVLAMYHNIISGWRSTTRWKEPGIIDQISNMPALWEAYIDSAGGDAFDRVLKRQFERLNRSVEQVRATVGKTVYEALPLLIIHGDFHPGNLKFQNDTVVGLFDFDWSMSEARCLDVGLALIYFCSAWDKETDGNFMLDRVDIFLNRYQKCAGEMGPVGAMKPYEMKYLPHMILAGVLYVLHWVINEYYTHRVDPDEYLRYLKHGVRSVEWLEHHWNRLVEQISAYSE